MSDTFFTKIIHLKSTVEKTPQKYVNISHYDCDRGFVVHYCPQIIYQRIHIDENENQ